MALGDWLDPPDKSEEKAARRHASRGLLRQHRPLAHFGWRCWSAWVFVSIAGSIPFEQVTRTRDARHAAWRAAPGTTGPLAFASLEYGLFVVAIFAAVTTAQMLILRRRVSDAAWWWIGSLAGLPLAAVSALVLGGGIFLLVSIGFGATFPKVLGRPIQVVGLAVAQYLALRANGVPRAAWWVPACVVGLGGGLALRDAYGPVLPLGTVGAVGGLVTATALVWILGQRPTRPVDPPRDGGL